MCRGARLPCNCGMCNGGNGGRKYFRSKTHVQNIMEKESRLRAFRRHRVSTLVQERGVWSSQRGFGWLCFQWTHLQSRPAFSIYLVGVEGPFWLHWSVLGILPICSNAQIIHCFTFPFPLYKDNTTCSSRPMRINMWYILFYQPQKD